MVRRPDPKSRVLRHNSAEGERRVQMAYVGDLVGHWDPDEAAEIRDPKVVALVARHDDHRGRVARPGPVDTEGVRAILLADHRDVVLARAPRDRLGAEERRLHVEERGLVLAREAGRAHLEPLPL